MSALKKNFLIIAVFQVNAFICFLTFTKVSDLFYLVNFSGKHRMLIQKIIKKKSLGEDIYHDIMLYKTSFRGLKSKENFNYKRAVLLDLSFNHWIQAVTNNNLDFQEINTVSDKFLDEVNRFVGFIEKSSASRINIIFIFSFSFQSVLIVLCILFWKRYKVFLIKENGILLKKEFMANMSHELQTPLHVILGFSELLMKMSNDLSITQSRYISQIYDGGKHLRALIEDILNLDKYEANQLELQIEKIQLDDFFYDAMDNFKELASKKEMTIHLDNQVECCQADPIRLTQMLYNLISNAIKFSKEGMNIYITIQKTKEHTVFLIRDEGCGIEKKYQKTIFEKFKQLENPFIKMAEGTGLGLPLAKALAQAHGGDLVLERSDSKGNRKGSTFKLLIP